MTSWLFTFSPTLAAPPFDGEVRLNAPPPYVGFVTRAFVHNLASDGLSVKQALLQHQVGTTLYVQARDEHYVVLRLTAPPAERSGYVELAVSCIEATPDLLVGPVELFLMNSPAVRDAATDPVLVTLAVAKDHLRVTDTLHDTDITQKMASASGAIRDFLKDRNDPTWTPETVPPWVLAAVLILLAHQYENRGDAFGDTDDRVWSAIANLLRRSRDPALA